MGLTKYVQKRTELLEKELSRVLLSYSEYKNIKKKRQLIQKVELTDEQTREIDKFYYENYGKKIKKIGISYIKAIRVFIDIIIFRKFYFQQN